MCNGSICVVSPHIRIYALRISGQLIVTRKASIHNQINPQNGAAYLTTVRFTMDTQKNHCCRIDTIITFCLPPGSCFSIQHSSSSLGLLFLNAKSNISVWPFLFEGRRLPPVLAAEVCEFNIFWVALLGNRRGVVRCWPCMTLGSKKQWATIDGDLNRMRPPRQLAVVSERWVKTWCSWNSPLTPECTTVNISRQVVKAWQVQLWNSFPSLLF